MRADAGEVVLGQAHGLGFRGNGQRPGRRRVVGQVSRQPGGRLGDVHRPDDGKPTPRAVEAVHLFDGRFPLGGRRPAVVGLAGPAQLVTPLTVENELARFVTVRQQTQPLSPADLGGDVGLGTQIQMDGLGRRRLNFDNLCQRSSVTKPVRGEGVPAGRQVCNLVLTVLIGQDGDDHALIVSGLDEGMGNRRVRLVLCDLPGNTHVPGWPYGCCNGSGYFADGQIRGNRKRRGGGFSGGFRFAYGFWFCGSRAGIEYQEC